MYRILISLTLLAGCADDLDSDSDSDTNTESVSTVRLYATSIKDFSGKDINSGELCSDIECMPISLGIADVAVDANSDVRYWVSYPGSIDAQFQSHVGEDDLAFELVAASAAEVANVAGVFGVTLDPTKANLVQQVFPSSPLTPSLSTNAEGPFVLGMSGFPEPGGEIPVEGGFYIFFNADVGDHVVTLPGCEESSIFWGSAGDGAIDVGLSEGGSLGLAALICS